MLKRLGLSSLALAAAMAAAVPTVSLAADRDDHRGRDFDRHERVEHRDRDDWRFRGNDRARVGVGFGFYNSAPAANGYYDRFGVWHAYGYYDQWGNYHPY